jgi:ribosome-binding protein aMBF1 (putative translation factor)
MLTHEQLKEKALACAEVRAEYERLEQEEFALLDILLTARHEAGLTQADIAARMGTKPPAIARLERSLASGKHSPSVATLRKYLAICGKRLVFKTASVQ